MQKVINRLVAIKHYKSFFLLAYLVCFGTISAFGNNFAYNPGDVLIGFRRVSSPVNDLVVNAGSITNFINQAANTTVTISAYNTSQQLRAVGTNNIAWTAFTFTTVSGANNVLYVSNPRSDLNTQTDPYLSDKSGVQGQVTSQMKSCYLGAQYFQNFSTTNSSTAVLITDSYVVSGVGASYYETLYNDGSGQFNGTFQAVPEQFTPVNFTSSSTPVRADFYKLAPAVSGNPPGQFLGYFTLNTNGVMTYTAYPSAVITAPVITSFVHSITTNTVTFTTGSTGIYTLRATNSVGLTTSLTNWPAISSVSGDGSSHTLTDISTQINRFYSITAQ
jgi:hypothetical protein